MDTQQSSRKTVVLPNGLTVDVSITPDERWETDFATFFINPNCLTPDPTQPRESIDPDKLDELKMSISELGVRDPIVVTPTSKVPWMNLNDKEKESPFIIVSGHRRNLSALEIKLCAVPVQIRIYKNEEQHKKDRLILNLNRDNLAPIEEAKELKRLVDGGISVRQAGKEIGFQYTKALKRMCLTKLAPNIQSLLASKIKEKSRLSIGIAETLGNLTTPTAEELEELIKKHNLKDFDTNLSNKERLFAMQNVFLQHVQRNRMKNARAIEYIEGCSQEIPSYRSSGTHVVRTEKFQPANRLKKLNAMLNFVLDSTVLEWTLDEFKRILHYRLRGDVQKTLHSVEKSISSLGVIAEKLKTIIAEKDDDYGYATTNMIRIDYYEFGVLEKERLVTYRRYIELWENGRLRFQEEDLTRPKNYPTIDEAKKKSKEESSLFIS